MCEMSTEALPANPVSPQYPPIKVPSAPQADAKLYMY